MPALKNFVAVDWRSGKDRIYFFFKDTNRYSRFNVGDNQVSAIHPANITEVDWGEFHTNAKDLKFGFTTTSLFNDQLLYDADCLWLFYQKGGGTPYVCKYNQDSDKVEYQTPVSRSVWRSILPYFNSIVAGTWWQAEGSLMHFRFLMDNGNFLLLDFGASVPEIGNARFKHEIDYPFRTAPSIESKPITSLSWPGLVEYKDRIITAVQNDRALGASYLYIFLTNNEYIRYNMALNKAESDPIKVDDDTWPGLLRD